MVNDVANIMGQHSPTFIAARSPAQGQVDYTRHVKLN